MHSVVTEKQSILAAATEMTNGFFKKPRPISLRMVRLGGCRALSADEALPGGPGPGPGRGGPLSRCHPDSLPAWPLHVFQVIQRHADRLGQRYLPSPCCECQTGVPRGGDAREMESPWQPPWASPTHHPMDQRATDLPRATPLSVSS